MSKKLLEESTIRQFMKLAQLEPLAGNFLKEGERKKAMREEEDVVEEGEKKPEQGPLYRYQVEVSTHQMLHQTIEMVSATPLSKEQITERAIEEARSGEWTRGAIDRSIDIDDVLAEF